MEFPKSPIASTLLRRVLPVVIGAAAGFAYYTFIGCTGGSCPITSNPWVSTAYGGLIGFVASGGITPRTKSDNTQSHK